MAVIYKNGIKYGGHTVIPVVQVTGTSTTDVMSQNAVTIALNGKQATLVSGTNIKTVNNNAIVGSGNISIDNVFWCTYGTTTYAEITSAIDDGKLPVCYKDPYYYVLCTKTASDVYVFSTQNIASNRRLTCSSDSVWGIANTTLGTITGITMNGASKGTSGVVDLGTVLTAHQDISGKQDKASVTLISGNEYRITFP